MQFPEITSVKAAEKYKLHVTYDDSTEGLLDVSHLAGKGVFKTWEIDNNFYRAYISNDSGAITWPGELDIDTINVYCKIKGIEMDEFLNSKYHYAPHI